MTRQKILAVIGMAGAGKSSAVKVLVSQYHLPYLYFGGITLEEVKKRGLPENQESEKKVRQELRQQYGMAAYARLSLPKITELMKTNDTIIIDGLYSWSEYKLLKESLTVPVLLLCILSRRANRYQRLSTRPERPLSFAEAEKRDFSEIETLEKGGPIALCDYYIPNDGSIEELEISTHNLAKELNLIRKS